MTTPPFGRLLTAMVTPFGPDGALDTDAAAALATYLIDDLGHDGLVINGTTGEAPTTTEAEKSDLVHAVVEAVGDRASVVAGVGTFATTHTLELAQAAQAAGADGLLAVTPYYSKPPQEGLLAHFIQLADAVDVPVLLYDIPHRTGTAIAPDTLLRLAEHPRIVGVKDAKGDLVSSSKVMAASGLTYYSGDDALTLPLLSVGAAGVIGTSTHFCGRGMKALIDAALQGRPGEARQRHRQLLPIFTGVFATQGCILVKAGLALQHRGVGGLRSPMVEATAQQARVLAQALTESGLDVDPQLAETWGTPSASRPLP